ncbi:single-stranded-DNA-specific exonuclease RecJ [Leptospira ryugenii]|uniref:Single-stranded-DNA-specific exonuclease RecJ n=1 Tax=Leptospira ryugenii TaxID=1917863 RepID=A0A2P2DYA6_9LEPT|nr:single-stranded-DNA-specific exonuclease RecJ [Leptospira ryugenii]GBF49608.1 single-stranded-DNA-specific exonuclease RecJ [Leptospira ryugenii]
MHYVKRVLFGPTPTQIRSEVKSKRPILRYLVDRREALRDLSAHEFLASHISFLHSPFSLPDLLASVQLLFEAQQNGAKILLYGDRDSDGVSSSCLLGYFLRLHPDFRSTSIEILTSSDSDPYGLSKEAIQKIKKASPDLLVCLDFGSSQADEIESLTQTGVKVIVLDHHEIPARIPKGCLLVNPRRLDSMYPEKKICTSVLSFKLVIALLFYKSAEFNKVYVKKTESGEIYFQNGLMVLAKPEKSEVFPFPDLDMYDAKSFPQGEERLLFYHQCKQIPNFEELLMEEIDLAGIGTITDMMPLTGENRMIVKLAVKALQDYWNPQISKKRIGTKALLQELQLNEISPKDLGWTIGPVLNAAGRMGKTEEAVKLLLSEDSTFAKEKAKDLVKINSERKERTARNLDRMQRYFARKPERLTKPVLYCYEPDMEPGVSGIVATKMVQDFKKVAVFVTPDHGEARGSIRAYDKENVLKLLESLSDHFLHFGGHPEAAGFSIRQEKLPDFEEALYKSAETVFQEEVQADYDIFSDICVEANEINDKLYKEIIDLAPFGQGNPEVRLALRSIRPMHVNPLSGGKHIKFQVLGGGSLKYIVWNRGVEFQEAMSQLDQMDLVGYLEKNNFRGQTSLQFIVEWFGKSA